MNVHKFKCGQVIIWHNCRCSCCFCCVWPFTHERISIFPGIFTWHDVCVCDACWSGHTVKCDVTVSEALSLFLAWRVLIFGHGGEKPVYAAINAIVVASFCVEYSPANFNIACFSCAMNVLYQFQFQFDLLALPPWTAQFNPITCMRGHFWP